MISSHGVDRQAVIKAYDVHVQTPADRQQFEQKYPQLVALRDQAVSQLKREQLQTQLRQTGTANPGEPPMKPAMTGSNGVPQPADLADAEDMGAFVEDALTPEEAEQSGSSLTRLEKQPSSESVAQRLIDQIKQGTAPWQRRSEPGGYPLPFNPTNDTRYKGVNLVVLMVQ